MVCLVCVLSMNCRFAVFMPVALVVLIVFGNGCTSCFGIPIDWTGNARDCDDPKDPAYDTWECIPRRCDVNPKDVVCDGGVEEDGGSSASSSGSSARCSGTCVSNAPNDFSAPQPVYIGVPLGKYAFSCPDGVGAFGDREYLDLHVPDPGCPSCICGPIEGTCNPRPNNIQVRAGTCDVPHAATEDFAAPENWDGSCTSLNAVPAGRECPPGSGIPCAQSVFASTLLEPEQGCESIPMPVPRLTNDLPRWKTMVLSCSATPTSETCTKSASQQCLPSLPRNEPGWRYCVRHEGQGVFACPSSLDSDFSEQVIAYTEYVDERRCTACGCKATGGECWGTLRMYEDETCTNDAAMLSISSNTYECNNVPPGLSLGSKEMTDLVYLPGTCEPTGGLPVGAAYPDQTTATTWCCMPTPIDADAGVDASTQ